MRSPALRAASTRVLVLRAAFVLLFLLLAARAAHLAVVDTRGLALGDGQIHTVFRLPSSRGLILDRAGVELAVTVHAPSVYVVPDALDERDRAVKELSSTLGIDARALGRRLRDRHRFTYVARWVTPAQARRVNEQALAGVGIVREPRRAYPAGRLAASLLGFANIDGEGVRGVEQQEDGWLKGAPRSMPVERDAKGRLLSRATLEPWQAAGGDVALTIDAAFQAEAEAALADAVEKTHADGGVVVTLDPHTGEILSLAEAPGFDPNRFRELDYDSTRSRAFQDAFEPGSVLKAFLVAAALEEGTVDAADVIDCGEGWLRVPGKTIRDARAHGPLDVAGVLRVSSNVGAVQIAQQLGSDAHHAALTRFGFGVSTGSGFPFESAGLLRSWRRWQPVDHATVAFGQGVGVTAVQLAAATASIANGGEWLRPRLVRGRRAPGGEWRYTQVDRVRRVVGSDTAATLMKMLETVVGPEGTGRLAGLRGLRVAGKTGTAQKLDDDGTYSDSRYVASFIGAVPARDPRLVIVALLDEPKGDDHSGGSAAAPLFARVAAAQLARLGIITAPEAPPRPPRPLDVEVAAAPAAPEARPVSEVTLARHGDRLLLPDFRGLSVGEVRRLASKGVIELEVRGEGLAIAQEPAPGTILAGRDRRVRVEFAPTGEG